jgi:hypothetical protein
MRMNCAGLGCWNEESALELGLRFGAKLGWILCASITHNLLRATGGLDQAVRTR